VTATSATEAQTFGETNPQRENSGAEAADIRCQSTVHLSMFQLAVLNFVFSLCVCASVARSFVCASEIYDRQCGSEDCV
jgi:hypothetical protein